MTGIARAAGAMVGSGKGLLAADESVPTMNARLEKAGVRPTVEARRAYREMLVTTPGLPEGVSGVILCDETFRQPADGARAFPEALAARGLLPGIKVDTGAKPLAGSPGEKVTEGLDGLRERLAEYAALGARFAKWRAVFVIRDGCPSWQALRANAHALARYASLCQETGLVPIIEPEVLMDGAHTITRCGDVTSAVLFSVFAELQDFEVDLAAAVLKPNMVLPGTDAGQAATPEEVAAETLQAFDGIVPEHLAGIAFLSGGQDPATATANLAALARAAAPWPVTFSFGRALVGPPLAAWHGEPARVRAGQHALARLVAGNVAALRGGDRRAHADSYPLA